MNTHLYLVLILLSLFTPFAFGASEPWGLLIFNLVCICFSLFILFKKQHFYLSSLNKIISCLLGFIIILSLLQLLNQHTFLKKPAFLPFTLCRYYSLEGLSLLFSLSLFYFVLTQIVQRTKELKIVSLILTASAVLVTLIGITWQRGEYIQFFTGISMLSSFGPFASRNHGSQFVMASFFISLLLWLPHFLLNKANRLPQKNIWYLTFSFILFVGVFFTHSRGGVLALFGGLFTIVFISILFSKKSKLHKSIYAALATVIFGGIIFFIIKHSADIGLRHFGTFSDKARLLLYGTAFDMLKDFPLTGVGFDAFSAAIDAYLKTPLKDFPRYLHNDWLELLLSFGYLYGTIIFATIILIIVKITSLFKNLEPKKKLRLAIICGALTGLSFTALIDFPFHLPACAFLFFCLLVFASASTFDKNTRKINLSPIFKAVILILSLFFLVANMQYFRTWRSFVFAKKFAPQTQVEQMSKSLDAYPSPIFIKRVLLANYKNSKSKALSPEEQQNIKKHTHSLAAKYLKQYPKDKEISNFFLLTK